MKDLYTYLINCSIEELVGASIIAAVVLRWIYEIITGKE
jgi:hypothetical protein